MQNVRNSSI